jgi:transposase InsO family protein
MVPHGRGGLLGVTGFDRVDDVRVPFDIHVSQRGAIFTATPRRGGRTALQVILGELGIKYLTSRPYHPQTCGKIERFHQTLKKRLPALPRAHTIAELQYQLDDFLAYYNRIRPHRAAVTPPRSV